MFYIVGAGKRIHITIDYGFIWENTLNFKAMLASFLNSFGHNDFHHVLLNMVCFFIVGLYLERKIGSIKFAFLILASAFFTSVAVTANNMSINWLGFSGVLYALYAYILIDFFILCCSKQKRNKFNLSLGAGAVCLIYLTMCFHPTTEKFVLYPIGITNNLGHYSSFVTGIILTLGIKVVQIKPKRTAHER
jgi:membrane associated rhomboid family serine protease